MTLTPSPRLAAAFVLALSAIGLVAGVGLVREVWRWPEVRRARARWRARWAPMLRDASRLARGRR